VDINEDYADLPEANTSVIARQDPHLRPTRSESVVSLLRTAARELARVAGGESSWQKCLPSNNSSSFRPRSLKLDHVPRAASLLEETGLLGGRLLEQEITVRHVDSSVDPSMGKPLRDW